MVKHIVMWRVDPAAGDRDVVIEDIRARLESLPAKIGWIRDLEVGVDANRGPAAWDIVLHSVFDSFDDLDRYQVDPAHKEVAAFIGAVVRERAVADYEV